jgi:hypothetical protein
MKKRLLALTLCMFSVGVSASECGFIVKFFGLCDVVAADTGPGQGDPLNLTGPGQGDPSSDTGPGQGDPKP